MQEKHATLNEACGCASATSCRCSNMRGSMCGWCTGRKHHVLKWVLGLVIVMTAFWAGVKLGEIKERLEMAWYPYLHPMMRGWYGMYDRSNPAPGVMGGWYGENSESTTTHR